MHHHLQKDIEKLKKRIITLGTMVEEALYDAVRALQTHDEALAIKVIKQDKIIDELEVEVEDECLKILALHQPVAGDLRYVVAILKINNDLERIGDLAANIAQRGCELRTMNQQAFQYDFTQMTDYVKEMLHKSLDAMINLNVSEAKSVCNMDDEVDNMHRRLYAIVEDRLRENPELAPLALQYVSVSRYLERIADQVTNIAEDVIYQVEGSIARHQPEKLRPEKEA